MRKVPGRKVPTFAVATKMTVFFLELLFVLAICFGLGAVTNL